MRAVMKTVPPEIAQWRRTTGQDRWDEVWEGVLHMSPSPAVEHQVLVAQLYLWLQKYWAEPGGGRVYMQVNVAEVGSWPGNYRIPDLSLLTPPRFEIVQDLYFNGGPDVVIEVRSPDDETYEKLPFYAAIGVREVWVVDCDTKVPEVYESDGRQCHPRAASADGRIVSPATGIEMLVRHDKKLALCIAGRPETAATLP